MMFWLMGFMWLYLLLFFILGMLVRGFLTPRVMTPAGEDIAAELATVRTRLQETEAERARMKARVAELNTRLEEARKEVVSAEAKLAETAAERDRLTKLEPDAAAAVELRDRVARLEGELEAYRGRAPSAPVEAVTRLDPPAEPTPLPAPKPEPAATTAERVAERFNPAPESEPESEDDPEPGAEAEGDVEPHARDMPEPDALEDAAGSASPTRADSPDPRPPLAGGGSAFLSGPVNGEPDDLTRIKGIGAKMQKSLNDLGVYYFRQIASWSESQVAEVDAHMAFPGRILRDDWRGQAKELAEQESRPTPGL